MSIQAAIELALAESLKSGHARIFKLYSLTRRGIVLDAEWCARGGKCVFIPTMWIDVAGTTRVKERPLEPISVARCVEMLAEIKADIIAGSNVRMLETRHG